MQLWGAVLMAVFAANSGFAEESSPIPVGRAIESVGPSPANLAARSALFPAWGQLSNGKNVKASALFALEAYLATGIVIQTRRGAADRRAEDAADAALDVGASRTFDGLADAHFNRRRDLIFWGLLAMLYGVVDAYVDGYLGDFDKEIDEGRRVFSAVDPTTSAVEVGVRF